MVKSKELDKSKEMEESARNSSFTDGEDCKDQSHILKFSIRVNFTILQPSSNVLVLVKAFVSF